jgi:hypothetical protein
MTSAHVLEVRRTAKLRQLAGVGPFLSGSLIRVQVRCGKANCRCANGQPHEAHVVSRKEKGRTASYHVPTERVEDARRWANEYRNLKRLIREIASLSEQILRLHVRTQRARRKRERTLKLPRSQP